MIIQNKFYSIGDSAEVHIKIKQTGDYTISSYLDDLDNETADRYFTKEFSVSLDSGNSFSSYVTLNDTNLDTSFKIDSSVYVYYKIRYTRSGTDTTGYLAFNELNLIGTIERVLNKRIVIHNINFTGDFMGF